MRAHAPGSITGLFVPPDGDMAEGARGVSFAVSDGVSVAVRPADEIGVTVDGEPAPFEPVDLVLEKLDARAAVDVRPDVPLGHGFGASGAATLATALAANEEFDLGRDRETLVELSHQAEVEAGTGLGDVFIQDAGGLLWSDGAGTRRAEVDAVVEYTAFGPIDTSGALGDADSMARVREEGSKLLDRLPAEPDLRRVTALSWQFASRTGLATERVEDQVRQVQAVGGEASMAMLGETVFGVDVDGVLEHRTEISNNGAVVGT